MSHTESAGKSGLEWGPGLLGEQAEGRRAQKGEKGTQEEAGRPQPKHWKIPKQERPQCSREMVVDAPCCLAQCQQLGPQPWPQQDLRPGRLQR